MFYFWTFVIIIRFNEIITSWKKFQERRKEPVPTGNWKNVSGKNIKQTRVGHNPNFITSCFFHPELII
jgi:hypothetical protein